MEDIVSLRLGRYIRTGDECILTRGARMVSKVGGGGDNGLHYENIVLVCLDLSLFSVVVIFHFKNLFYLWF